jgi:hypothetical protein
MASIACRKRPLTAEQFESIITSGSRFKDADSYISALLRNCKVIGIVDWNTLRSKAKSYYPEIVDRIIARADETMSQTFRILGFPPHRFPNRIEWQKDFIADIAWDKDYYLSVPLVMWNNNSDLKLPWELSRGHYLVWLAEAWQFTGNRNYLLKLVSLIEDWIESNPYPYGVNWACPMEAAIRMINWIAAFEIFGDSETVTIEFAEKFYRTVYQHAVYIEENLEVIGDGMNTNHYLTDLLGLLIAGSLFRDLPESRKWRDLSKTELEKEIKAQTLSDGFCYESSMNYQTLTSEVYLLAFIIGSGREGFSQEYRDRLEAMLRLSHAFLKPDGTLPNFGDGDSGRILIFDGDDRPDTEKLLDIGALTLKLPELRTLIEKPPFDSVQLLGADVLRTSEYLRCGMDQPKVSQLCRESGLATLRKDGLYLFFGANPIGSGGIGGHKHNDMLTIEISCGETNFIVDSGTYTYTSNSTIRNRFRSTSFHSVPAVKNIEQNRFIPRILFAIHPDADVTVKRWESNDRYDIVEAEHSAYARLPEPLLIVRSIYFDKINGLWVFKDSFYGHGSFDFQSNLILGDVTAEIRGNDRFRLISKSDDTVLEIISFSPGWSGEIIPHEISPYYGMKKEVAKITLSHNGKAPTDMIWAAIPSRAGQDISDRTAAANQVTREMGWGEAKSEEPISGLALSRDS